jgi:hypothetical protein
MLDGSAEKALGNQATEVPCAMNYANQVDPVLKRKIEKENPFEPIGNREAPHPLERSLL